MNVTQLKKFCVEKNIPHSSGKNTIIFEVMQFAQQNNIPMQTDGFLKIIKSSEEHKNKTFYGLLRSIEVNFLPMAYDIYISARLIKEGLRAGDHIVCEIASPITKGEEITKYFVATKILTVNEKTEWKNRNVFEDLTATFPTRQILLENSNLSPEQNLICRELDLIGLGFGQRALVGAPPKTGKTTILHAIASSIVKNYPKKKLIILLICERPEEKTETQRIVPEAEIISSTFDMPPLAHIETAELTCERIKRLVELKEDVIVLMDSLSRLVMAYNYILPSSGKIWSGGLDPTALQLAKQMFCVARNTQEGGSATIIATVLMETGSKIDDVIFDAFKGTGNSEIKLERRIAEHRIFPAIDLKMSGTRQVSKIFSENQMNKINILFSFLSSKDTLDSARFLQSRMLATENNNEFFNTMHNRI